MTLRPLPVLVFGACLMCAPASAQIVNVQSTVTKKTPEGFSGKFDASIDWRTGNTELLVLSGALVARYKAGANFVLAILRGEIGLAAGERIIAKTFEHLRYRRTITDLVTLEAFAQHETDEFRRLSLRALGGGGPKLDLLREDKVEVSWGLAYMLEVERLGSVGQPDDGDETVAHRASTYVLVRVALTDRLDLLETVYCQPRLTEFEDIRVLNDLALVVKITSAVAIKTSFNLAYDSRPPLEVERLDTVLKSSVSVSF